jgi:nicotinamide mononucleotide transporter
VSEYLTFYRITEILGACFSIVYSLLLMREKTIGWLFGILSSLLGIVLFFETRLYAQGLISIYYAAIGVYGWYYWSKAQKRDEHIHRWKPARHIVFICLFTLLSWASAYLFKTYTDSSSPYLDSFLTVFGFLASLKEAWKVMTSWLYWLVINLLSVWLYFEQDLYVYAAMMIIYAAICIPGYLNWRKIYYANNPTLS